MKRFKKWLGYITPAYLFQRTIVPQREEGSKKKIGSFNLYSGVFGIAIALLFVTVAIVWICWPSDKKSENVISQSTPSQAPEKELGPKRTVQIPNDIYELGPKRPYVFQHGNYAYDFSPYSQASYDVTLSFVDPEGHTRATMYYDENGYCDGLKKTEYFSRKPCTMKVFASKKVLFRATKVTL